MTKISSKFNRKSTVAWAWLILVFAVFVLFQWFNTDHLITSDDSAEMLLSKVLSEENTIISENWYYSTEIRILSLQLIQIPLFKVFNSWHLVRFISSIISVLIIEVSFCYLMKRLNLSGYFPYAGSIFMMPFCEDYYFYVLNTPCYALVIATSFLLIAMTYHFAETSLKPLKVVLLVLIFSLSAVSGMSGPRQLLMTQAPICLAVFIKFLTELRKGFVKSLKANVPLIIPAATELIAFAAGYLMNSLFLSSRFNYFVWNNQLIWEAPSIDKFANITSSFISSFGFSISENMAYSVFYIFSGFGIFILSLLVIYLSIRNFKKLDYQARKPVFLYASMLITYYGLYMITDMLFMYATRYALPIAIFILPLIISVLTAAVKKKNLNIILTVCLLIVSVGSAVRYLDLSGRDTVKDRRDAAEFIVADNISNVFTTFWDGSVITEITNGEIDAWIWLDEFEIENLESPDMRYEWMQSAEHINSNPEGRLAVLLKKTEVSGCPLGVTLSSSCMPSYETENYIIYVFESYADLEELFS